MSTNKYLFTICFFLISCASIDSTNRKADIYTRLGYEYLNNGSYPEALKNFLEAEELSPSSSTIQNGLAMSYFARDKYDLAIYHIKKSIDFDPKNIEAQNNMGRILISLEKYDEAEKALKTALSDLTFTQPEKPLTNMGLLYSRKGSYKKGEEYFLRAIQTNRSFCPAYKEYGNNLVLQKQYDRAGPIFDKAVKICENSPEEVHYLSALSYYQSQKNDFAVARLREVIKLYPESEYADKAKSLLKVIEPKMPE